MSKAKNSASNNSPEETTSAATPEAKASATKHSFSCPEDYSPIVKTLNKFYSQNT